MREIILDSELEELMHMLRRYDLSFLGQRACSLAEELSIIVEDHLEALFSFHGEYINDLRD